jgi:hypothetical protein
MVKNLVCPENSLTTLHKSGRALVAHTCNAIYSKGRDHKNQGSKPTLANSKTLSQKYPTRVGPRWLTPIILATQEAETRRIEV